MITVRRRPDPGRPKLAGRDLLSLSERIDTTSVSGEMIFRMLAVLAEFERDLTSERTRMAFAHKRGRSERIAQIPYGKALGPDGRTPLDDRAEVELLDQIRDWRAEHRTFRRIAAELTARGVPTKNGGTTWSHSSVQYLARRTA